MENEIENADSTNGENDTPETDINALKEKLNELSGKNKQLFERAKKAEGDLKEFRSKEPEKPSELKPQSDEPDYAKLAYLNSKGYDHPDDQKWLMDESQRLKLPLTDVMAMDHAQAKLKGLKSTREAKAGMPKGRGDAGGQPQSDVDYWLAKGETPDDLELAEKVINARMQKEKSGKMFSDELYTG